MFSSDKLFEGSKADILIKKYSRFKLKNGEYFKYSYGTSGFRGNASYLNSIAIRLGIFSVYLSHVNNFQTIGLTVTASHNPAEDNGFKVAIPSGEMLESQQETTLNELMNIDEKSCLNYFHNLFKQVESNNNFSSQQKSKNVLIYVGCDTRDSSQFLLELMIDSIQSVGGFIKNFGLITTPQLHYLTQLSNTVDENGTLNFVPKDLSIENYVTNISDSFYKLLSSSYDAFNNTYKGKSLKHCLSDLTIDCSCGIGSIAMKTFADILSNTLPLILINKAFERKVNDECGAEYVQKARNVPVNVSIDTNKMKRFASFDGDADRIVYFYIDENGKFILYDGDRIICLFACYVKRLLECAELAEEFKIGVAQTAYANGSSTIFLRETMNIDVVCTKTGVKNLHPAAKAFDIGIYFENNGHGTITFSSNYMKTIEKRVEELKSKATTDNISYKKYQAALSLQLLPKLINQAVGDAISDMLMVEIALYSMKWDMKKQQALYNEVPSTLLKACVLNRAEIKTSHDDRFILHPKELQNQINECVSLYKNARAFVRPSGTEDIVRIYSEASTQNDSDELSYKIKEMVTKFLGPN